MLPFPVPRLGLGCAPLASMEGTFGYGVSEADAVETVRRALERGVTLLDTAPFYANGRSEVRVGLALRGLPRERFIISTKVGWLPDPDRIGQQGAGERSYTREAVLRSIEGSLKRLGLTYLDIAHVHDPEAGDYRAQIMDEAYPTLLDLKAQGVIRAIGAGLNQTDFLVDFARHAPLDCAILAGRYTLLEQAPLREAFPLALSKGIGILAAGVFNGGILATGARPGARYQYAPAPEPILRLTRMIEQVCAKHGVALRAAAMQFAAAHPAVQTLIIGMAQPKEVDENLADFNAPIPAAFWAELKARELIEPEAPTPGGPPIAEADG
ncbi:MAG: aldo/keto reductase [Thermoflexales bacterium]|nr:aldo/keto reductase [Thermoflexales bacterium]MDW8350731.1 aldo/keto reductase [Anaerolineae bacterium]